jgi:molybdopterin converting factor small subunit
MTITLRLFGELKHYAPQDAAGKRAARVELPDGMTAVQLILHLGIPYGGEEGQMVVAVNDVEVDHSTVLREGDAVSLFEPLAGGSSEGTCRKDGFAAETPAAPRGRRQG